MPNPNRRQFARRIALAGLGGAAWASYGLTRASGAEPPSAGAPVPPPVAKEEPFLLTPKPPAEPRINGPKVAGVRPGHEFIYRIPCTGQRPMQFAADNLPKSIALDPAKGILRGPAPEQRGEYMITLHATNRHGKAARTLKIVVGDMLALTPPMGWNDWYCWYDKITEQLMRQAADAMVASGMADFGYQYVNIDDCWMIKPGDADPMIGGEPRDAQGRILPNKRFPDIKGMVDYMHSLGLRAGIYTSPGPLTCAKFEGSYKHEELDARQFAEWGFDFLKYDWCSYQQVAGGNDLESLQRPYKMMSNILQKLDRDFVFNLCQYGRGDVWKWGAEVGGHCWRTTGDVGLEKDARLPGFYSVGMKNAQHWEYARPGAWNDPDYILIGTVGPAGAKDRTPRPTSLTPNEQYSYMAMWSLMAAPLFFSGDMNRLDEFTLNVLCNAEVIEVNQDPLGKQARIIRKTDDDFVLAKPLEDGSLAVGLFNLAETAREMAVSWKELGLSGPQRVRDLWRQKDLDTATDSFSANVNRHGVAMVRLWRAR
ncbi:MAG: alpha-galactosidase [Candidatus Sumerlaeia bacterium]|nr:alpha-galactosidase [Candidatus Sumerlaeia bacterium]